MSNSTIRFARNIPEIVRTDGASRPFGSNAHINVMDGPYNCIGDGVADDTVGLQAAFNAVAPGGRIKMPAGTYNFTSKLTIPRACYVEGEGRPATLLNYAGTSAIGDLIAVKGSNINDFYMAHLGIISLNSLQANTLLHLYDLAYGAVEHVAFYSPHTMIAGNNLNVGCLFDVTATGQVPPRGGFTFSSILHTAETDTANGIGSCCLWLRGLAAQNVTNVTIDGHCNLEQADVGLRMDYCSNVHVQGSHNIQGNTTNLRLRNSEAVIFDQLYMAFPKQNTSAGPYQNGDVDATNDNIQFNVAPICQSPNTFGILTCASAYSVGPGGTILPILPSLDFPSLAAPAAPSGAFSFRMYSDAADGRLKNIRSDGFTTRMDLTYAYSGNPETHVAADKGSYCADTLNGEAYIKTTDTANTGWKKITHA